MLLSEIFNSTSDLLVEHLGNLAELKVGKMINLFRMTSHNNDNARFNGNRGMWNSSTIGSKATIKTITAQEWAKTQKSGSIYDKLRFFYKNNVHTNAFALYLNNEALCLGKFAWTETGFDNNGFLAFDLSPLEQHITAAHDAETARLKAAKEWRLPSKPEISSEFSVNRRSWEVEDAAKKGKRISSTYNVAGKELTKKELKVFLDKLSSYIDLKKQNGEEAELSLKLVLTPDFKTPGSDAKTAYDRQQIRLTPGEVLTGADALNARLRKYKLSKNPTASSIGEFLKFVNTSVKSVTFAGRNWQTTSKDSTTASLNQILNGLTMTKSYACVDTRHSYNSIKLHYKFISSTGQLVCFKAEWQDGDGKNHEVPMDGHEETYIKHEFKIDQDISKESIMKSVLTAVKNNNSYLANNLMQKARNAGYDYPEFKKIEASLELDEKKKG